MEYSVGSLADLISGSNTPNKPKVIQKAFKKEIFDNADPLSPDSPKEKKFNTKQIDIENTLENSDNKKNKKRNKRQKKIKEENIENVKDASVQKIKKLKVKIEMLYSTEGSSNTVERKHNKRKKMNLETSTSDLADSDEGSPPKKKKTTEYQQNAERRVKKKIIKEKRIEDPELLTRTIFVGNIPINIDKKKVTQHFKKYGIIETIRIRGIPVADPKTSKKVAAITKKFNPNRSNIFCYIRYQNKEDALKAEVENGALFEEHHLRVHGCMSENKPDETKAIFVGNLSFNAEEDELWKLFEECGPINYVRIIRDNYTGMGKGFAYVNFKDSDAVQLALEMENVKLKDRELRIALCNHNTSKKKKLNKKKKAAGPEKQKFRKNFNKNSDRATDSQNGMTQDPNAKFQRAKFNDKKKFAQPGTQKFRKNFQKNSDGTTVGQNGTARAPNAKFQGAKFNDKKKFAQPGKQKFRKNFNKNPDKGMSDKKNEETREPNAGFQGAKFNDKKKKRKINKGLLEKKKLVIKIAPILKE